MLQGALFFHGDFPSKEIFPERPLGLIFLTSLRDIALEEYNGQTLRINDEDCYMKGIIEHSIEQLSKGGVLNNLVEIKGIITDDVIDDLKGRFDLFPNGNEWIFPGKIFNQEKIFNIPSLFRKLPKSDIEGRRQEKFLFEKKILEKMQELEADFIVSDGYMARIDYLQNDFGLYGKVLNIHPAPAIEEMLYCFRGKDEVMDAIRFARSHGGVAKTGATLHFVDSRIDNGLPIAYVCKTPVSQDDTELSLMYRNYQQAKLPLFVTGLRHYVLNVFPYLDEIKALI